MSLTRRRIYDLTQRKKHAPLVLEDWTARDALVVLLGSESAVERITAALEERPELLNLPAASLARELATVAGVGPGTVIQWMAAQTYAAKRDQEAPR